MPKPISSEFRIIPPVVWFALFSPSAYAASFDCSKAKTYVEQQICKHVTLSKLDEALTENYKGSLASPIGREARRDLKNSQKAWVRERNQCKSTDCIEKEYRKRLDETCNYPVPTGVNWGCRYDSQSIK